MLSSGPDRTGTLMEPQQYLPSQDLNEIESFNFYMAKGETKRASVPNWEDNDEWQFLD